MTLRIAIYRRIAVDRDEVGCASLEPLRPIGASSESIVAKFSDRQALHPGLRRSLPGLSALRQFVRNGQCDVVRLTRLADLGRDMKETVRFLALLHEHGVAIQALGDKVDTLPSGGGALLTAATVLMASEAHRRREAIRAGQERSRGFGVRIGRPPLPEKVVGRVRQALENGLGTRAAGRACGVSPATVVRVKQGMTAEFPGAWRR